MTLLSLLLAMTPLAGATPIGTAGGVRGAVRAKAPKARAFRKLRSGKNVFFKDAVSTGEKSRLQVLLKDETSITIGEKSSLVLDEFVYDPKKEEDGSLSAELGEGVFRFVTGRIARKKPRNMKLSLPVGTIGIRGTHFTVRVRRLRKKAKARFQTLIALGGPGPERNDDSRQGALLVRVKGRSVRIFRGGWGVTISPDGKLSDAFRLSKKQWLSIALPLSTFPTQKDVGDDRAARDAIPFIVSGQDFARVRPDLRHLRSFSELVEGLGKNQEEQAFDDLNGQGTEAGASGGSGVTDGNSTWADVLTLGGLGTASYTGNGTFNEDLTARAGTSSLSMNVDFSAKQITGGTLSIVGGGTINDSSAINTFSFGSLSGNAQFNPLADSEFNGTTFQFVNDSGEAAKQVQLSIQYSNPQTEKSGNGSLTATR